MEPDDLARYRQIDKLAQAIVDGKLVVLKGVAAIAQAVGLSTARAKKALEAGEVDRAWRTPSGRWLAIRPVLLAREPELPLPADQGGGDG